MNRTIIHFMGGGWCTGFDNSSVLENCYLRSFTNAGSTSPTVPNPWLETLDYIDYAFPGWQYDDMNFYNWNRFFFIYCDGMGH